MTHTALACPCCDQLNELSNLRHGQNALCYQCKAPLWHKEANSIDRSLALHLAALICFIIANSFPFISLQALGLDESNSLLSIAYSLYGKDMPSLALLVFLSIDLIPLIVLCGMTYTLLALKRGHQAHRSYIALQQLSTWSLNSIFLLATAITIAKLQDMATVIPGLGLFALMAFVVLHIFGKRAFSPEQLWPILPVQLAHKGQQRAIDQGLVRCHDCSALYPQNQSHCSRCHQQLHLRKPHSLQRTWAFLCSGALLLIPANLYPIMQFSYLGDTRGDTIISGIMHLIASGMWPLGLLVLIASLIVPLCKLISLAFLSYSVQQHSIWRKHDRSKLYRINEAIGPWSMVDIYLVALLCSLLNAGPMASVYPDLGALFFAAAVISTMLAAHSFDPRLIWDTA